MEQLGFHVFTGGHEKFWNITLLTFMGAHHFPRSTDIKLAKRPVPFWNISLASLGQ
jgi:hypothetical protein